MIAYVTIPSVLYMMITPGSSWWKASVNMAENMRLRHTLSNTVSDLGHDRLLCRPGLGSSFRHKLANHDDKMDWASKLDHYLPKSLLADGVKGLGHVDEGWV